MRWEVVAAVRLEKVFLYRLALYGLKKLPFPQTKRFSFAESFTLCPQKPLVFATKTPLVRTTFYCPQKPLFYVQKPIFCTNLSLLVSKTAHFHKPKVFLLHKFFLNCYPKQFFSTLRNPFQRPLTYCLQRIQLFFCCSL